MATSEHPLYATKDADPDAAPGRALLWLSIMLGLVLWTIAAYAAVKCVF